jgi:hypothetical protein
MRCQIAHLYPFKNQITVIVQKVRKVLQSSMLAKLTILFANGYQIMTRLPGVFTYPSLRCFAPDDQK